MGALRVNRDDRVVIGTGPERPIGDAGEGVPLGGGHFILVEKIAAAQKDRVDRLFGIIVVIDGPAHFLQLPELLLGSAHGEGASRDRHHSVLCAGWCGYDDLFLS
jgi:hypothetical protein